MKKTTAFFFSILTLFSAVSCSSNESSGNKVITRNEMQLIDSSNIYKKTELPYPDGINTVTDFLYSEATDKVYIIGFDADGNVKCCITDSSFSMYKNVDLNIRCNFEESADYAVSSDKIYAVTTSIDHGDDILTDDTDYDEYMRNAVYTYTLNVYDPDCNFISSYEIEITDDMIPDSSFKTVTDLKCAKESRLLLEVGGAYLLMDTDGKIIYELDQENINDTIESSGEYLSYYINNGAFYGVKTDNITEKLIDFANSGLSGIHMITPIADGDFVCCEGNKIFRLSERDTAEFAGLQEITLAVAGKTDRIQDKVAEFNSQSNNYMIKINNYLDGYDYNIEGIDSAVNDLRIDIISGKIPDMVWFDTNEINKLSSKGAFADLYEFIDSDKTFSRDAFLSNYLEATETNGHLYSIAPTFMIKTIAAKSEIANISNWTFDEFKEVYESHSDDMELFESSNNREAVFYCLMNDCADFIDYGNHTCSFDSADFINILEFSAQFQSVGEYEFEQKSCRNETAMLSALYISSFRDINVQKQCIFGDDITFVGNPSESENGSIMLLTNQFAIMEKSDNKDGAWEFIRSLLSDDNFRQNVYGIPVTESGLSIAMNEALEGLYYIDDLSGGIKKYWDEIGFDSCTNAQIKITPMTVADQKKYEQFVRSVNRAASGIYDSKINSIINEEADRFFAGECSASQCADMIQNRVTILLSEQS